MGRAKLVLWSAEGESNSDIANRLGWTKATVGKWRRRFLDNRLAGLYDEVRPGRPRSIEDEQVAARLNQTLSRKPAGGTHWTVRKAARESGISKSTVHRVFKRSRCNRTGRPLSNSRPIHSLSRRYAT